MAAKQPQAPVEWLLVYATPGEGQPLAAALAHSRPVTVAGWRFVVGRLSIPGGRSVSVSAVASGIGQANAAGAAAAGLTQFRPTSVAVFGVAGGYPSDGWRVGDLARGVVFGLGDEGVVQAAGWRDLSAIGIPLIGRPPADGAWNRVSVSPARCRLGRAAGILTVTGCSGSAARARTLRRRAVTLAGPRAQLPWVEDMETAAVAVVCARAGVPVLALRGISNGCGDRDKRRWDLAGAAAVARAAVIQALTGCADLSAATAAREKKLEDRRRA